MITVAVVLFVAWLCYLTQQRLRVTLPPLDVEIDRNGPYGNWKVMRGAECLYLDTPSNVGLWMSDNGYELKWRMSAEGVGCEHHTGTRAAGSDGHGRGRSVSWDGDLHGYGRGR